MPDVWRSRSMMVTGRSAGTSFRTFWPSGVAELTPTFASANAGMNLEAGSASESLPASINIIAATLQIDRLAMLLDQHDGARQLPGCNLIVEKFGNAFELVWRRGGDVGRLV